MNLQISRFSASLVFILCFFKLTVAAPQATIIREVVSETDVSSTHGHQGVLGASIDGVLKEVQAAIDGIHRDISDVNDARKAYAAIITARTTSRLAPTRIADVQETLSALHAAQPTQASLFEHAAALSHLGFPYKQKSDAGIVKQLIGQSNSFDNFNPRSSETHIYPRSSHKDAPYSLSEAELRKAIYIPSIFTYGQKTPVIMVPGTGSTGGDTYAGNFLPLLDNVDYADPVYLNVPGYLLHDAQVNAEYVAYAVNYISGISGSRNVSVLTWSQGSLNTQWALKYWPSTRKVVEDFMAISPDYHGTVNADILAPPFPKIPMNAAIYQQRYNSEFVQTLRSKGGDSAYVPTTTIYSSIFDEIVEPQTGTSASGYILDQRRVGVSNNELQAICPNRPAGLFYGHAGVLYNALSFALVKDALTHKGPGQIGRLDLEKICNQFAAPGLTIADVLDTEADILQAVVNIILVPPKKAHGRKIKKYAREQ